jgi:hypothetical protein
VMDVACSVEVTIPLLGWNWLMASDETLSSAFRFDGLKDEYSSPARRGGGVMKNGWQAGKTCRHFEGFGDRTMESG